MKKLLFGAFLFASLAIVPVSAWEPDDLKKYPSCMNENNWIINFGTGYYIPYNPERGEINQYIPSIRLSVDKNNSMGEKKLPFFLGGIIGYSGYGYNNVYLMHTIKAGLRLGYHFNWGVDNLDTYIVGTAGWKINLHSDHINDTTSLCEFDLLNDLLAGVNLGARWFVNDFFGFWFEAGISTSSLLDMGITLKL